MAVGVHYEIEETVDRLTDVLRNAKYELLDELEYTQDFEDLVDGELLAWKSSLDESAAQLESKINELIE